MIHPAHQPENHHQSIFLSSLKDVNQVKYEKDTSDLAYIIDQLDAMTERKWPIPSTLIDRFVAGCTDIYEWKFCKYYLYSFRHSPCGQYLRPWTALNWLHKGLTLEQEAWAKDNIKDILEIVGNKTQYGVFLHEVGNNYLLENLAARFESGSEDVTAEQLVELVGILYRSESFDKVSTATLCASVFLALKDFQALDLDGGEVQEIKDTEGFQPFSVVQSLILNQILGSRVSACT